MAKRVGFVGLGVMGRPMALNLVQAGQALTVFDLDQEAIAALVAAGAGAAASAREAATGQEVVVPGGLLLNFLLRMTLQLNLFIRFRHTLCLPP